jgi:hypothetical protein
MARRRCLNGPAQALDLVNRRRHEADGGRAISQWMLKRIRRLIDKSGGKLSLKIDWFAGKNLRGKEKKVVRLKRGSDYQNARRPSDHHPIWLTFDV